ncbi:Uncharacterised protein [Klebsiella pneumoniae]|nr:Uncharacterised protein [Klebsiella pneumoniae]
MKYQIRPREDFVELLNEMETFQPFLAMDE